MNGLHSTYDCFIEKATDAEVVIGFWDEAQANMFKLGQDVEEVESIFIEHESLHITFPCNKRWIRAYHLETLLGHWIEEGLHVLMLDLNLTHCIAKMIKNFITCQRFLVQVTLKLQRKGSKMFVSIKVNGVKFRIASFLIIHGGKSEIVIRDENTIEYLVSDKGQDRTLVSIIEKDILSWHHSDTLEVEFEAVVGFGELETLANYTIHNKSFYNVLSEGNFLQMVFYE